MLEVIEAGLYSTVQDGGRAGWGHLGVRRAGAADALALAAANLLVGNDPEVPAVEMTLLGGSFAVGADLLVALAGADMEATVPEESRRLSPGASYRLRAGTTLSFGAAETGARAYLAVAGGLAVGDVLGSASTDPVAGFGGIEGRPLLPGDVIPIAPSDFDRERRWPAGAPSSGLGRAGVPVVVPVVEGPHLDALPYALEEALPERVWRVSQHADRVGLRLEGEPFAEVAMPELVSLPMLPGAVQLPANGKPIVLMPDAPTVGGYPVPAVVAAAERHRTGQLRPGDELRFRWISLDAARQAALEQGRWLADIAASLP